jgi:hypothetical protein
LLKKKRRKSRKQAGSMEPNKQLFDLYQQSLRISGPTADETVIDDLSSVRNRLNSGGDSAGAVRFPPVHEDATEKNAYGQLRQGYQTMTGSS